MLEQKRFLPNGEMIIKTEEGIYFHSISETSMPILIDKEEGELLFGQSTMTKKEK